MQFTLELNKNNNDFNTITENIMSNAIENYKCETLKMINENRDVLRLFEHCRDPPIKWLTIDDETQISDSNCIYKIDNINSVKYLSAIEILVHSFENCTLFTYWCQPISDFTVYIKCEKPIKDRPFNKFKSDIGTYSNYKKIYNFTVTYYTWVRTMIKVSRQLLKIAMYPNFSNAREIYNNYYKNSFLDKK